jgi:hypothetical protein
MSRGLACAEAIAAHYNGQRWARPGDSTTADPSPSLACIGDTPHKSRDFQLAVEVDRDRYSWVTEVGTSRWGRQRLWEGDQTRKQPPVIAAPDELHGPTILLGCEHHPTVEQLAQHLPGLTGFLRTHSATIAKILKEQGIPPSRQRPMTWRTFLRAHWQALVAADFFTTEVWTVRGLVT